MDIQLKTLPWKLIIALALVALTRPVFSAVGVFDDIRPQGPVVATILIGVIWVTVAVWRWIKMPVITLAAAGIVYALLSTVLALILHVFMPGPDAEAPSLFAVATVGLISGITTNALLGGFLGYVSAILMKARARHQHAA